MAYQPFPKPFTGHISQLSTGMTPVSLADAGDFYVVLAARFKTPFPVADYQVLTIGLSVMTTTRKEVEWEFMAAVQHSGDALVYSGLDPLSVFEGSVGNGTQKVTFGVPIAVGRYVPGEDERGLIRVPGPSDTSPTAFPKGLEAFLTVRGLANAAAVVARAEFQEIELLPGGTTPA